MGKVYLSQFNFENYKGAENINLQLGYIPEVPYLENYALAGNNGFFLSQDEPGEYNYTLSTENVEDSTIFLNQNLSRMCKDLTNLYQTDLTNKTLFNYKYVTNMHTSFANCFRLFQEPISAKYIKSMYGTYYNDTNIYGVAAVNANVINMIGTYYNCGNLITSNCRPNVSVMVDSYHDCWNITGRPACGDNVKSLYNAYYNCFNLLGAPANCNNALVTINTYYNCPNLYGDFYWYKKDSPYADEINATNMFYNRNCDSWLNIFVYPNKAIFNALVNYSATYGNLYGVGALEWTKTGGMYGFNNYVNDLYKTKIVEYFSPINITGYDFNNYVTYSESGSSYTSVYRNNCTVRKFAGIYNNYSELPIEDYGIEERTYLNEAYGIYCLTRSKVITTHTYSTWSQLTYWYNLYQYTVYVIINDQDPETICWKTQPSILTVNDFDYIGFFNLETYLTNLYRLYDTYSYKNNQVVIAQCSDKVTDMVETYYLAQSVANPANNGKYIPWWLWSNLSNEDSVFYHALPNDWDSQTIQPASNISIRPACGPNVVNMIGTYQNWVLDTEPVCGLNVIDMYRTYTNCRGITEPACGDNVVNFVRVYFNTDVKNPYFGPNVQNAFGAYGYTNTTTKNLILPNTILDVGFTYRNCNYINNLENLNFNGIQSINGCFLGCPNLTINSDTNIMYAESFNTISYLFYNCWNITDIMPFPRDRFECPNMAYTYAGCRDLINLRENHFTSKNFNGTFAWCTKLQTGTDKIYFTNNTRDINFIFANCSNIIDDINWILPENHQMHMSGCFQYCRNINYINIQQNAQLGCIIDGGMFAYCNNLKNINIYPAYQDGTVYANYDYLFCGCSNLEYIHSVQYFNGRLSTDRRNPGNRSNEINSIQTELTNNCFSFNQGNGGHSFSGCRSLKVMPNFVAGGYFGEYSFQDCHNLLQINFQDGDYCFYNGYGHFSECSNLQNIVFNNVYLLNFFNIEQPFYYCMNLNNVIIQGATNTLVFIYNLVAMSFFEYCNNIQYLFKCDPINHEYNDGENIPENYIDLFPIRINLYNCKGRTTILANHCSNLKDYCNCPYLVNYTMFSYSTMYANTVLGSYCNNLRGLMVNCNNVTEPLFNRDIYLMNLNYLQVEVDEALGYINSRASSGALTEVGAKFTYFNKSTHTQTVLNYLYLGIYNRWTGNYINYEDNSYVRTNVRDMWRVFTMSNLFTTTDYHTINMLYIDDRVSNYYLPPDTYERFDGDLRYTVPSPQDHFFNITFKNGLKGITSVNSLIISPQGVKYSSGNMSFELQNIINSRNYLKPGPYTSAINNLLPLTSVHCNYIYVSPHPDTTLGSGSSFYFISNYVTPTQYSGYDFSNIITNTGVSDVSLIFGIDVRLNIETMNVAEFTHQRHIAGVDPSKIKMNYGGQEYTLYPVGTLGAHIAYLGGSHSYVKYFGDMTFTETKTLIANAPERANIYHYQYGVVPKLEMQVSNDIVTDFDFSPFHSMSLNNVFNLYLGMSMDQVMPTVGAKNYTINLYEVDLYNASRNIHIKYIEEELNFID